MNSSTQPLKPIGAIAIAIAALFFFSACSVDKQASDSPARPNIVFIIADDLGWSDVGFHNGNVPTPNLRKLASEGLEIRQHYVAPVCSPTRAGFLTGRYWSRFGITTPTNELGLPFETITVAKALGEAGYNTAITGKW
ncbi:MAG: sulfatase family protein, partial [Verrucomicrobiia bacterium]